MTLTELAATLERLNIYPVSLTWQHVRDGVQLTDPIRIRWTVYVATCDELAALTAEWNGKRGDRAKFHGSHTKLAVVDTQGLIGHVCHTGLPCWPEGVE